MLLCVTVLSVHFSLAITDLARATAARYLDDIQLIQLIISQFFLVPVRIIVNLVVLSVKGGDGAQVYTVAGKILEEPSADWESRRMFNRRSRAWRAVVHLGSLALRKAARVSRRVVSVCNEFCNTQLLIRG
jgi:hypothetical protein